MVFNFKLVLQIFLPSTYVFAFSTERVIYYKNVVCRWFSNSLIINEICKHSGMFSIVFQAVFALYRCSPLDDLLATLCHNSDTITLYSALWRIGLWPFQTKFLSSYLLERQCPKCHTTQTHACSRVIYILFDYNLSPLRAHFNVSISPENTLQMSNSLTGRWVHMNHYR